MNDEKPWDKIPDSPAQEAMRQAVKSETPETDAHKGCIDFTKECVPADFARKLERRLTSQLHTSETLRIANGVLAAQIVDLKSALRRAIIHVPSNAVDLGLAKVGAVSESPANTLKFCDEILYK